MSNSDLTNVLKLFCRLAGVINIIALIFLNHEYLSANLFSLLKRSDINENKEQEQDDEINDDYEEEENENENDGEGEGEDLSEFLNDENFEKFLQDCKFKFKNNLRSLYGILNKDHQFESINDIDPEDIEIEEDKYYPEEIDEIIEERIRDKYLKNFARFLINMKINKKKANANNNKNTNSYNEGQVKSNLIDEEKNENNINNDINVNKNETNFNFSKENLILFTGESIYSFIDIGLTYFTLCLLLLYVHELEQNIFILCGYYVMIFIIMTKVKN